MSNSSNHPLYTAIFFVALHAECTEVIFVMAKVVFSHLFFLFYSVYHVYSQIYIRGGNFGGFKATMFIDIETDFVLKNCFALELSVFQRMKLYN